MTDVREKRGLFVTFEGGEGSGKSTLMHNVAEALKAEGTPVFTTREPGSSSIGPALRRMLLDYTGPELSDRATALLMIADRAQHVHEVLRPALELNRVVLCDRYVDSSIAYQGAAQALGMPWISEINSWATEGLTPDITFLLDIDPVVGLNRKAEKDHNVMERMGVPFHDIVREGFRKIAEENPHRVHVLDATQPAEELTEYVRAKITEVFRAG